MRVALRAADTRGAAAGRAGLFWRACVRMPPGSRPRRIVGVWERRSSGGRVSMWNVVSTGKKAENINLESEISIYVKTAKRVHITGNKVVPNSFPRMQNLIKTIYYLGFYNKAVLVLVVLHK